MLYSARTLSVLPAAVVHCAIFCQPSQVLAFEALHASNETPPRLKKFMGKPTELSPKARVLNFVVRNEGLTGRSPSDRKMEFARNCA